MRVDISEYEGRDRLLAEFGEMLRDELTLQGCEVNIRTDGDPKVLHADLVVLMGDVVRCGGTLQRLRTRATRPKTLLWQLEPLARPAAPRDLRSSALLTLERTGFRMRKLFPAGFRRALHNKVRGAFLGGSHELSVGHIGYRRMERVARIVEEVARGTIDEVFASTPERTAILREARVSARYLPVGYHPMMEASAPPERDIDVLFLGREHPQRDPSLSKIAHELKALGHTLTIERGPVYGAARASLLSRARISLQIGALDDELPRMRTILSMAAGAVVIAEERGNPAPFIPGEHLVFVPATEIPRTAARLLEQPEELQRISEGGRRLVVEHLTMRQVAEQMLQSVAVGAKE